MKKVMAICHVLETAFHNRNKEFRLLHLGIVEDELSNEAIGNKIYTDPGFHSTRSYVLKTSWYILF